MQCNKLEISFKTQMEKFCWNNKAYKREYKNENIKLHYINKNY